MEKIRLPMAVKSIGETAFVECSALKEITIPEGLKSIGDEAFAYCSALERIIIPDSVESIGDKVFADCVNLKEINISNYLFQVMGGDYAAVCEKLGVPDNKKILKRRSYKKYKDVRKEIKPPQESQKKDLDLDEH